MHKRKWSRVGLELLILAALVLAIHAYQTRGLPQGAAPPLVGQTLSGETIALATMVGGEPILVHFWATWCPVCSAEEGNIEALARGHKVVSVAMSSGDAEEVRRHVAENALTFPVINDPDGKLAAQWGVRAVPTTFVLDGAGRIRFAEVGYTTELGLRARLWWAGVR